MPELLRVSDVNKSFTIAEGIFRKRQLAVLRNINIQLNDGETLGLVGESGSGKTTLARIIMGMIPADSGEVLFDGLDLCTLNKAGRHERRRDMAFVYQNPFVSLNPRLSVFELVAEPIRAHDGMKRTALEKVVSALLEDVGLDQSYLERRIAEMSGGQAQRVAIARALALKPKLIVLDEPTSALDVSVQAQVLNLLASLRRTHGYTYLLITHNLEVVRHMADKVLVMAQGEIVEQGDTDAILDTPQHPYTQALVAATPCI